MQGLSNRKYERAFLWGCVEPDLNIFTYLKGTLKIQPFRGHNFNNSKSCILSTIGKLQQCQHWKLKEYYRLGKLMHYIADAFTYPHNENYREGIRYHRSYEKNLHGFIQNQIMVWQNRREEFWNVSVPEAINLWHLQYLKASIGVNTDVYYIVKTTNMAFNLLLP